MTHILKTMMMNKIILDKIILNIIQYIHQKEIFMMEFDDLLYMYDNLLLGNPKEEDNIRNSILIKKQQLLWSNKEFHFLSPEDMKRLTNRTLLYNISKHIPKYGIR